MEQDFWHNVWQKNTIGFHQGEIHPFLDSHIQSLIPSINESIFVPFCGKSKDMLWLNQFGTVVGAELSEIACRDFFEENNLDYAKTTDELTELSEFNSVDHQISLWQGDFFNLTTQHLSTNFSFIYDRAALIALPRAMRSRYVEKLKEFMSKETQLLLVSLEYPENEMSGPPFPVDTSEVSELFKGFQVEELGQLNLTGKKFTQRLFDVSRLVEKLYLIRK